MPRTPPASVTYIELLIEDDDDPTDVRRPEPADEWRDAETVRVDFDRPSLTAEEKLIVGYLTLEEHGMFATLSLEEQQQIAATLRR